MKKLIIGLFIFSLAGLFVSCHLGRRHTTIVENDNHNYMKIEYAGDIHFNDNGTAIASISRGGYVKYRYNEQKLEAKNNGMGGIRYELYDGDHKLSLDENGKRFIAEAVKKIIQKAGRNPNLR